MATGGIETVRLLLASRDVCQLGIGNDYDNVGRYYMCHIAGNIGELAIAGSVDRVRHGYEISADGIYCRRRLALSAAAQRQFGVANMIARLHFPVISDPAHGIGVLSCLFLAKHLISYEYAYRLHDNVKLGVTDYLQHVLNVISDPLDTATFAWRWLTQRTLADRKFPSVILRNRSNHFSLDIHSEQLPNPSSRITLADSYDELSMPRVRIDWRYLPEDIDSVRRTLQVFAAELSNSGVASYRFDEAKLEDDLTRFGAYGGHHIGTTRMGDNPKTSVVDRNGKLHTQRNLYIAGSSVFPTSGQANPTLTVIALTLRLAEHLATVLTKN